MLGIEIKGDISIVEFDDNNNEIDRVKLDNKTAELVLLKFIEEIIKNSTASSTGAA